MLHGCKTGAAKITRGYRLPARHVIHTVGPVWQGGGRGEDDLLASCYRASLALAGDHRLASIAFPAISTGIYRFPADRAAGIAVATVTAALPATPGLQHVVFCCFDRDCRGSITRRHSGTRAEVALRSRIEPSRMERLRNPGAPMPSGWRRLSGLPTTIRRLMARATNRRA